MEPPPAARRWRRHPLLAVALFVTVAYAAGLAVDLWRIRQEVEAGRTDLAELSIEDLDGGLTPVVERGADHLSRARSIAHGSPFLRPLGVVPGARGQLEGLRSLTAAADRLGASSRRAARALDADLDRAGGDPTARLALLDTAAVELERVAGEVAAIDTGPAADLPGPLGAAHDVLETELDRLPARLDDARARVEAARQLLEGPTRYLVLAANNAEMRGGAGMPLSAGVATFADGAIELGGFEPTANRFAGPIDPALVPGSYAQTYRQFRMGVSWLQTAVSPNFPTVGRLYAAMSAQSSFGPVDGVLVIDVVTLRHLLAVTGPVEVGGTTYTADNVEQEVLNGSYLRYATGAEGSARHDAQGAIASAVFDALQERQVDVASLARALRAGAAGRHLLAYASDPAVQQLWADLGATGELAPNGLMVTVQNIAADKLDWYIDPTVTINAVPQLGTGAWKVRLSVRIPNPTRSVTTPAIESFKEGFEDGVHRALVAVYLPEAAYDVRSVGRPTTESGPDGPLTMIGQRLFIEEGDTGRVAVELTLPPEHIGAMLLPSGRVRPVEYVVNGVRTTDASPNPVFWVPPDDGRRVELTMVLAAVVLLGSIVGVAAAVERLRARQAIST